MMYHDHSYRLLRTSLSEDAQSVQLLVEVERRLGLSMPPSVAEWYRQRDAISILRKHSNDDPPIDVSTFATVSWQSQQLLPIRYENQGVCTWAVHINGSDDPPVLVDVGTDGEQWHPCADTFSEYVHSGIWDFKRVLHQPALVQANNRPLTSEALSALRRMYAQKVATYGWPGATQYRFEAADSAILIWSNTHQADWFVGASNANALKHLLESIWKFDEVGGAFYECSDEGESALQKIIA